MTLILSRFKRLAKLTKPQAQAYGIPEDSLKFYSLIPKGDRQALFRRALLGKLMGPRPAAGTEQQGSYTDQLQDTLLDPYMLHEDEQVQILVQLVTQLPQSTLKKAAKQMESASSPEATQAAWTFLGGLAQRLPKVPRASKLGQKALKLIHNVTDRTWSAVGKLTRAALGFTLLHAPTTLRD